VEPQKYKLLQKSKQAEHLIGSAFLKTFIFKIYVLWQIFYRKGKYFCTNAVSFVFVTPYSMANITTYV